MLGPIFHPVLGMSRAPGRHQTGVNFHRHPANEFTIPSSLVLALPTIWSLAPLGDLNA